MARSSATARRGCFTGTMVRVDSQTCPSARGWQTWRRVTTATSSPPTSPTMGTRICWWPESRTRAGNNAVEGWSVLVRVELGGGRIDKIHNTNLGGIDVELRKKLV